MMNTKTKYLTLTAVLAAASILLSYFEVPIIPGASFLKIDFAEVPIILCSLILGPLYAIAAEFVRSVFALMMTGSQTLGIGTLVNFILGSLYVSILYFYIKYTKHKYNETVGMFVTSVLITVLGCVLNLVLFIPLYKMVGMYPMNIPPVYFVYANILPLNLIKWPILSVTSAVIYKYTKKFTPVPRFMKNYQE